MKYVVLESNQCRVEIGVGVVKGEGGGDYESIVV